MVKLKGQQVGVQRIEVDGQFVNMVSLIMNGSRCKLFLAEFGLSRDVDDVKFRPEVVLGLGVVQEVGRDVLGGRRVRGNDEDEDLGLSIRFRESIGKVQVDFTNLNRQSYTCESDIMKIPFTSLAHINPGPMKKSRGVIKDGSMIKYLHPGIF